MENGLLFFMNYALTTFGVCCHIKKSLNSSKLLDNTSLLKCQEWGKLTQKGKNFQFYFYKIT